MIEKLRGNAAGADFTLTGGGGGGKGKGLRLKPKNQSFRNKFSFNQVGGKVGGGVKK